MKVVGISTSPDGMLYGSYAAVLNPEYMGRDKKRSVGYASYGACILVRCPNDTDYTAVDLQIAYENSTQCRLR